MESEDFINKQVDNIISICMEFYVEIIKRSNKLKTKYK